MPRPPNLIARDARILAAYSAGATIPQIAATEQLDPAIVRTTLRRHGLSCPRGRHPLDPTTAARLADPAWLAAEYATKSAPEIAAELGCTASQVFGALKRAGIARRRREEYARLVRGWRTWPADVQERAVELYCAGWAAPAVAQELGVNLNAVYELLRDRELVRSGSEAQLLANARRIAEDQERRVQRTIEQLRACDGDYASIHQELERKRLAWWEANHERLQLSGSVVRQAYTLIGELNAARDNLVVVFHSLTADADPLRWWGDVIGPGRAIDTRRYAVLSANLLGSCYGTTRVPDGVRVTPPYPPFLTTLLCLVPFGGLAVIWVLSSRRKGSVIPRERSDRGISMSEQRRRT